MKIIIRYSLFILCFSYPFLTKAQINETLFRDTSEHTGANGIKHVQFQNNFIVSGIIRNGLGGIICIDSNGNSIWEVLLNIENPIRYMIVGNDSFLYASTYEGDNIQSWKINPLTGQVLWNKRFKAYGLIDLVDYDSLKFILPYIVSYGGSGYRTRFAFVSKITGDTISTHFIGDIELMIFGTAVEVDSNKDIYFTHADSVIKVSGTNPNNFIWRQRYATSQIRSTHFLRYYPTNGFIYAIGSQNNSFNRGFIAKINATNGTLQDFESVVLNRDVRPNAAKLINNKLFASWQHMFTGSVYSISHVCGYNLTTDTIDWNGIYNSPGGGLESVIDFDVDDSGYIFTTGYMQSANHGPGKWLNIKMDPNTGDTLHTSIITKKPINITETLSNGFGIAANSSRVLVFGNIEEADGSGRSLNLTILDRNNFSVIAQRNFGSYRFPSKTINIKKHLNGSYILFKQIGRGLEITRIDSSDVTIWKRAFTSSILDGYQLEVASSGDIYFSAAVRKTSVHFPYTAASVDSICIFHLDQHGNLKGVVRRFAGLTNTAPLKIIPDDSFAILLFHQRDTIYAIKTRNNSTLGLINTQMRYQSTNKSQWNASFDKNSTELFLFGPRLSMLRVLKIRKQPFVLVDTLALPVFVNVEHTNSIDSSRVVLIGRTSTTSSRYGVYNTTDMRFEWSLIAPSSFNIYQSIIDSTKTYLYVIGKTTTNDIRIQKHLLANGNLLKAYTYVTGGTKNETPVAIHFNESRRKILIAGSVTENINISNAFIFGIDTSFNDPIFYVKPNPIEGADEASCIEQVSSTKLVAGGYVKTLGLQWGALFEFADTFFCKPSFVRAAITGCSPYYWNGRNITNSGTYYAGLLSSSGCDSIVELDLTILPKKDTIIFDTACKSIVWRGTVLTQSGVYSDTLTSFNGCDSIVILNLFIDSINTTVNQNGNTLTSNQSGGTYQWIDCLTNTFIPGANAQSFTPSVNGIYSVLIFNNFCYDTSDCINITLTNTIDVANKPNLSIYPNPFSDYTILTNSLYYKNGHIRMVNALGEEVYAIYVFDNQKIIIDRKQLSNGMYFLLATFDGIQYTEKLIIKD